MSFKLIGLNDGKDLLEKTFTFNGGEEYVKLKDRLSNKIEGYSLNYGFKLIAHLKDSKDVMKLLMIKDAFDRLEFDKRPELHLVMPYVPYARQDRVCVTGESHSLAVFCKLINACNFTSVTVVDPHSHVTEALLDNVKVITQLNIISHSPFNEYVVKNMQNIVLVSPDAGANKKTFEVAKYFGINFIRCDKLRDLATGQIKETEKENYNLNIAINGIEQLYQAAESELKRLKRSKGEELEKLAKIIEGLKNELLKKDEAMIKKNKIIEQYNLDIELFVKQRKEVGEIRSVLRTLT